MQISVDNICKCCKICIVKYEFEVLTDNNFVNNIIYFDTIK